MVDERKISLCITNYNRFELLINSFIEVLNDDRISEIIISDDVSRQEIYRKIEDFVCFFPKIKLYRNAENQDCYKNKYTSLTYANNKWCILFDSDNTIKKDYLDSLYNIPNWDDYVACLPSFAMPYFDYRPFAGRIISKENVAAEMHSPTFSTMLNTANCFVNKDFYIQCWDGSIDPHTSDSIYMNYRLLSNGGKLYVVPDLHYEHRVDNHQNEEMGHYVSNCHKTGNFHAEVEQKLKDLR